MGDTVLRELDRNLWAIDQPLRVGGLELGVRTCLIRLDDGGLLIHAPGPLTALLKREIERLGPVRALIAPNLLHHKFLAECSNAFPQARVFGAPGLREKLDAARIDDVLAEKSPPLWSADLEQSVVQGVPALGEIVFFHRESRTLLCVDLCFNLLHCSSPFTRTLMRLNGAYGHFGPSRVFRYAMLKDASALRISLDRILEWDFDRVTVAHGEVLESGGREEIRGRFKWLRD